MNIAFFVMGLSVLPSRIPSCRRVRTADDKHTLHAHTPVTSSSRKDDSIKLKHTESFDDSNVYRGENYQKGEEKPHRKCDHCPSRERNLELNEMLSPSVVGSHLEITPSKIRESGNVLGIATAPEQVVRFEGRDT